MQQLSSLLLALFVHLALIPTTFGGPLVHTKELDGRLVQSYFAFASIGDSWAAGQAVVAKDAYGGPEQHTRCYRHKASWEALMAGDNTWTDDPIAFKFAACSGSKLDDATKKPDSQISKIARPDLLTMQLGGNDAHFGDILVRCIYIGDLGYQRDYPDPDGGCFDTIKTWEKYLDAPASAGKEKSFYFDHHKKLQDILATDLIKDRDDFYFYIIGYGEFFNVKSPDSDWCNDQSFGIIKYPKLSNALRTKLNELSRKINAIMSQSISDLKNDHFRFFDPSSLFENHRFCEPGHTLDNQYFLNDVWFWNMSPPEDDPTYAEFQLQHISTHETAWAQNHTFINGTQATQTQLMDILNPAGNPYDSWSGRAFHPKDGGHLAIKNGLIKFLRDNNVPGIKQAAPPPPPPRKQPYASGQMHIHINEFWDCHGDSDNLSVEVTMWDGAGTKIGYMKKTQAGASASARMGSKLEDLLVITPEWARGGYIQFQLGPLGFNTIDDTDDSKPTHCHWGGFDPREGPPCWVPTPGPPVRNPAALSINQVDCWFPSPDWHGGSPSDGSSL